MKTRSTWWWPIAGIALLLALAFAYAETRTIVNQGRPGNEGPWPVTGNIFITSDGGFGVVVNNNVHVVGADGGVIPVDQHSFPWLIAGADAGAVPVTQASFPWFVTGPDGGRLDVTVYGPDGGPLNVSVSVDIALDGGAIAAYPGYCDSTLPDGGPVHKSTAISGAGAVNCPTDQAPNRQYIVFCVNAEQGAGGRAKIRIDGVAPIMGAANPGDVLERGDCVLYPIKSSVVPQCISNGNHNINTFECLHAP